MSVLLRKSHKKEWTPPSSRFCHVWIAATIMSPAWERSQVMVAEQRQNRLLNAIVEWVIQPALDSPCPLEFLICELINSLLFKPAWVRVLFLPPKASWLIWDSKQTPLPLLLHPAAELNAIENDQQPISEAAHWRAGTSGGRAVMEYKRSLGYGSISISMASWTN